MPIGNPSIIFQMGLAGATKNPKFASLSPQAQAALQQAASYPPGSALRQANVAQNPDLQAAIKEAQQAGILDNTPLWQSVLKGTALTLGAAIAAPAIAGALGGGAPGSAAATGGSTLGEAGPLAADEAFAAGPIAGAGMAGVDTAGMGAGTAAASTGFGAALKSALPSIIGGGAALGGAAIAAHGNTEAAKIQAASADKALAQAKAIYEQNVARQSPFVGLGTSALGPLSFGMGLPDPNVKAAQDAATAQQGQPIVALGAKDATGQPMAGAGQNQTIPPPPTYNQQHAGTLASMGGGTVRIQDPATGNIHLIPQSDAQAAIASGGRPV